MPQLSYNSWLIMSMMMFFFLTFFTQFIFNSTINMFTVSTMKNKATGMVKFSVIL